jgi:F0F1-type ATP synthase delta subunit
MKDQNDFDALIDDIVKKRKDSQRVNKIMDKIYDEIPKLSPEGMSLLKDRLNQMSKKGRFDFLMGIVDHFEIPQYYQLNIKDLFSTYEIDMYGQLPNVD